MYLISYNNINKPKKNFFLAVALPNENLKKILSVGRQLTAAEGRAEQKKTAKSIKCKRVKTCNNFF